MQGLFVENQTQLEKISSLRMQAEDFINVNNENLEKIARLKSKRKKLDEELKIAMTEQECIETNAVGKVEEYAHMAIEYDLYGRHIDAKVTQELKNTKQFSINPEETNAVMEDGMEQASHSYLSRMVEQSKWHYK